MQTASISPQDEPDCAVGWHALYTRHQHEKIIAQSLSNKGIEVFLPLYNAVHQWKDRTKTLSLPLFPCYVFLRARNNRRLDILTTPGVHMFVTVAGQPALIDQSEIEAVRRVVECTLKAEPHPFLKYGDRVRVRSGPLAGIDGILLRKKGPSRLVLSVEMLEKSIAVEIDAFLVERISGPSKAVPSALQSPRAGYAAVYG